MDIRCFFGCHDYESFGDGIKILDIIERSARIKADALYMKDFEKEIYNFVRAKTKNTFFGSGGMKEYMIDTYKIRDKVCLRCGKIQANIQRSRAVADSQAIFAGSVIRIREDRQKKAKALLDYKKELNCM